MENLDRTAARRLAEERLGRSVSVPDFMWHLDRIIYADKERIEAAKGVTGTDYCWVGHLQFRSVMPASVVIEFVNLSCGWHAIVFHGRAVYPVRLGEVLIRRKIEPGSVLVCRARLLRKKLDFFTYSAELFVNDGKSEAPVVSVEKLVLAPLE